MTEAEIQHLGERGWFVRNGFPGAHDAARVAQQRAAAGAFGPAAIARDHHRDESVRNDRVLWVSEEDAELAELRAAFEALRDELNQGAWLGLTRFDLQLAHYPGDGARYVRHKDALEGAQNRRLTAIVYLNPDWEPSHGGQLQLHSVPPAQVAPVLGQVVVFLATAVEHEVLPTWAPRLAATAWYYGG
jgi:SM-20-related protein